MLTISNVKEELNRYTAIKTVPVDLIFYVKCLDTIGGNIVYLLPTNSQTTVFTEEEFNRLTGRKIWSQVYSLESVTDFYADNDFEDAIQEVCENIEDLSQRIKITVELVE